MIGTVSQFFGREMPGYDPLPEWAEEGELPPESVRAAVKRIGGQEFLVGIDRDEEPGDDDDGGDINAFFGDEPGAEEDGGDEEDEADAGENEVNEEEEDGED